MAVSKGRKSTKASKTAEADKKFEKKAKPVELPKVEEAKQPEVVVAPPEVKEEVVAPKVEEQPAQASVSVVEEVREVQQVHAVQEEVREVPREVSLGSTVRMPNGKIGTVIRIDRKGRYEVRYSPRKSYLYEKTSLSLVK
jgi:hypothetical protein